MTIDITSIITTVIGVAGTALVGVITAKLVPWLKSKLTATQLTTISQWIKSGVKAAETLITGSGTGAKKFQYVLDSIKTACTKYHITYDETAVKNEIQAVWNDLYNESNPSATQVSTTSSDSTSSDTTKAAAASAISAAATVLTNAASTLADTASSITADTVSAAADTANTATDTTAADSTAGTATDTTAQTAKA